MKKCFGETTPAIKNINGHTDKALIFTTSPKKTRILNGSLACWNGQGNISTAGVPTGQFLRVSVGEMQACAESYLGEEAGQALLTAGLMPVLSHKNRNAVTVMRFQSVAAPAQPLAGLGRT